MAVLLSELSLAAVSSSFFNLFRIDSRRTSTSAQIDRVGFPAAIELAAGITVAARRRQTAKGIFTADELHHVSVPNSDWQIALWRYLPCRKAPTRNHPLLLLSGVATNAIGYDLSPECSFARFMSGQGFDTWILELRGAGLSSLRADLAETDLGKMGDSSSNKKQQQIISDLLENFIGISERLDHVLNRASRILGLQERVTTGVEGLRKQLALIPQYNWDFDHYLEEDVPSAMEYVRAQSKPKDGKLLAIGHSMGGILLYAMLSKCCFEGRDSGLASVTTLASTLDYTSSRSSLKYLLPLTEPVQALNVPVMPIGGLFAMAYPLVSYPLYALSWLTPQISAPQMMSPELFKKLVLNNFCTVPAKLLLQLSTAFEDGGLRNRTDTFYYKDHINKSNVPILALAGDWDLICPPEAVYETVKLIPEHLVTYKVLGEPGGPHYAHYDLVGGLAATNEVYQFIVEFLERHDET